MRAEKEELQEAAARERLDLEQRLKAEQEQQSALQARVKEMEEQARLEREAADREKARLEVRQVSACTAERDISPPPPHPPTVPSLASPRWKPPRPNLLWPR